MADKTKCEQCHVQSERIRNLAHWMQRGHFGPSLTKDAAAAEVLKLVTPLPMIIGCDRCGLSTVGKAEDVEGWKIPNAGDFDDVILCPNCQEENPCLNGG